MATNKIWLPIALGMCFLFSGCHKRDNNLIRYVNPLIGTGKSASMAGTSYDQGPKAWGQVIPAVSTPFGMTQWTPQTNDTENKCVAPYYYDAKKIQGFRGTHWLGGSCTQDYGSFTIMPITGYLRTFATERATTFIHDNEISTPAYYSCMLEAYTTFVEMTGTARSGFFKFSYLKKDHAKILVTPNSDQGQGYIQIDPERQEIYGYNPVFRVDGETDQPAGFNGYFVIRFNQPFNSFGCYFQMEDLEGQKEISGKPDIGGYAAFDIQANSVILAKVGTSFTSIEAARANLEAEIPHWDFLKTKAETEKVWNEALSTIQIKAGKPEEYTGFYTALYHSLLYPRTFSDVDGSYPAFNGTEQIRKVEAGHVYYDDFLLASTHRAQLPLVSLIAPAKYEDMMKSLVLKAEQGGQLPVLPLRNCYNSDRSGGHAVTALGDAWLKGFDINIDKAYPLMRKYALEVTLNPDLEKSQDSLTMQPGHQNNPVGSDGCLKNAGHENKEQMLACQFAESDFVLSKVAEKYGKVQDAEILAKRAQNYIRNGISKQYLLPVDLHVPLAVYMHDNKQQVRKRLDMLFAGRQYQHWDAAYHAVPYLYNYSGDQAETQKKVKSILSTQYNNYDSGIPGNDEAGQKSAWYVFSAMGFYPIAPGSGEFQLSSPVFSEIELHFDPAYYPGKHLKIVVDKKDTSKAFNSTYYNKKDRAFMLTQVDIQKGGTLVFSDSKK